MWRMVKSIQISSLPARGPARWLIIGLLMVGIAALLAASDVGAQEPVREYRFEGRAIIDGSPAPKGTSVEIRVGSTVIAASQVSTQDGNWSLRVNAELLEKGVCDATFFVDNRQAERQWNRCTVNIELEVTKPQPPTVPPVTTPPTEGGDPPTDPPGDDDPPTGDPPGDGDPPDDGDPPGDDDPPTGDPPGDDDPPTGDPPGDDDPPTGDPPGDDDPPTGDPPGDDDPPTGDPPGDDDPPGGDRPDDDPPTKNPPVGVPPSDENPDDDTSGDPPAGDEETDTPEDVPADEEDGDTTSATSNGRSGGSSGETVRPQSPPGTGTGGLLSTGDGATGWYVIAGGLLIASVLAGSSVAVRRRRRTG